MHLQFLGAATTVTGSQYLLTTEQATILIDCGMFQGSPNESIRNRIPLAYDPTRIDAILLTHAHLDHCGLIPHVVKAGFKGPVWATKGTVELATLVLLDSGKLQEEFAKRLIRREKHDPARAAMFEKRDRDALTSAEQLAADGVDGRLDPADAAAALAATAGASNDDGGRPPVPVPVALVEHRRPGRVALLAPDEALGELLLELARVEEDQGRQLDRPLRRPHRTFESGLDHVRDQAAMVEVGMGQQDRVDPGRIVGQRNPVANRLVRAALEHPAVDQDRGPVRREQVLRAGHRGGRAEELEVHARSLPLRSPGRGLPVTRRAGG